MAGRMPALPRGVNICKMFHVEHLLLSCSYGMHRKINSYNYMQSVPKYRQI